MKSCPLEPPSAVGTASPSARTSAPDPIACWFDAEVRPHESALRSYLRYRFSTIADTDDLIQETYQRLLATHAVRPVRSVRGFLYVTARNLAFDLLRRQRSSPFVQVDPEIIQSVLADDADVASVVCHRQEIALLGQAVASLPPRSQEALILCRLRGLPQRQAAVQLGVAESTVERHVGSALRQCADYLQACGAMPGTD